VCRGNASEQQTTEHEKRVGRGRHRASSEQFQRTVTTPGRPVNIFPEWGRVVPVLN
jgi:hypothetical protein